MKIIIAALAFVLALSAGIAQAEVRVVIDRSTNNEFWRECAKTIKKIIVENNDNYYNNVFFQVEISADIHSDGWNIATIVRTFRQGEECPMMVFNKILFADRERAVRIGEIMGKLVRKQLEELMRVCRITKISSLNKAAFFIAQVYAD